MNRVYRAFVFALYQMTLLAGIALLPVAIVTQRFGIKLPVDRFVVGVKETYEQARGA